jgi:hypothetical protein
MEERRRRMCGRQRHIRSGWRLTKPALGFAAASMMLALFVSLVVATSPATEIPEPQPERRRRLKIWRRVAIGRVARGIAVGLERLRIARDIPVGLIRLQISVAGVGSTAHTQGGERQRKRYFQSHDDQPLPDYAISASAWDQSPVPPKKWCFCGQCRRPTVMSSRCSLGRKPSCHILL